MSTILSVRGLTKKFGGLTAVNNVDFNLPAGELHAIIGPNGAGKTTFFNLVSGFLPPSAGRVVFDGQDITGMPTHRISQLGMARTLQVKSVFNGLSVYDNVWIAAHSRHRFLHPLKSARTYGATADDAAQALAAVELTSRASELAGNLAYGDVALLEIAIAIAMKPKLLLLDEPVAGMGSEESQRMVACLATLKGRRSIILVEHDMDAVFSLADRISVLVYGRIIATGTPQEIRANADVRRAYLGEDSQ